MDSAELLRRARLLVACRCPSVDGPNVHSVIPNQEDVARWIAVRAGAKPWELAEVLGFSDTAWFWQLHSRIRLMVRDAPASRVYIEVSGAMQLLKAMAGFDPELSRRWAPVVASWEERLA